MFGFRVWQHVDCMGIDRNNIPDEYLCEKCQPRRTEKQKAIALQLRKKKELLDTSDSSSDSSSGASTLSFSDFCIHFISENICKNKSFIVWFFIQSSNVHKSLRLEHVPSKLHCYVKSWIVSTNLRGVYDKTSLVLYLWALSHYKLLRSRLIH